MSVSVVVLSHRPGDWLEPCLSSVVGQADEVVVIDNGSEGASASHVASRAGATVVRLEQNAGYAAGVNAGVRAARGDVVALLNDDAEAEPGWLSAAQSVLSDPGIAAVVPKVLRAGRWREVVLADDPWQAPRDPRVLGRRIRSVTAGGTDVMDRLLGPGVHELEQQLGADPPRWRWTVPGQPFYVPVEYPSSGDSVLIDGVAPPPGPVCRLLNKAGGYLRDDGIMGDHGDGSPDDGRWDRPAERFFASGTALVATMDAVRRVGEMAEPFFAYYEDGDWSWRARLAGLRIVYDPSGVVVHRHSATSGGSASDELRRLARRNRFLCLARNAPAGTVAGLLWRGLGPGGERADRVGALRRLPWAFASRRQLARGWRVSPSEVWDAWAGVDTSWDTSPARSA